MLRVVFVLLFIFCAQSQAQQFFPYEPVELCKIEPYKSQRDFWDQTGTFCYQQNGQTHVLTLTDMGEIKLRDNGQWADNEYVAALTPENRAEVGQYDKYYVRYLSNGQPIGDAIPFVAHVFFKWGPGTQTLLVFGKIRASDVVITGYSDISSGERRLRSSTNTLKNLLEVFNGRDPSLVGWFETMKEDRKRVKAAGDVINKYRATKSGPVPGNKP